MPAAVMRRVAVVADPVAEADLLQEAEPVLSSLLSKLQRTLHIQPRIPRGQGEPLHTFE